MKYFLFGISELSRCMFMNLLQQRPNDFIGEDCDFLGFTVDSSHIGNCDWLDDLMKRPLLDGKFNKSNLRILPFMKIMVNPHSLVRGIYLPIYDNKLRETKFKQAEEEMGLKPLTFVDKRALVDEDVDLSNNKGSWIQAGTTIQTGSQLGNGVIFWANTHCGHSAKVSDFCFVSTNSTLCGNVEIAARNYVGVGVHIKEGVKITGTDNILGMGSIITKNIETSGNTYLAGVNNLRKKDEAK